MRRSGELRLLMVAESHAPDQRGPARILTISDGPDERNLTIGQERDDLVVRVRRRGGGPNGVRPFYRLPDVFATGEPRWISVVLTDRSTAVRAGGRAVVDRLDTSTHWWALVAGGFWPGVVGAVPGAFAYWLALLGPVGLVIGTATSIARRSRALTIAASAGLALACWLGLNTVGPGGFGYASLAGAVLAIVLGTVVGRRAGDELGGAG